MQRIDIERLHVRIKGVSPHVAQSAIAGLGSEILNRVAAQDASGRAVGRIDAGVVDPGILRVSRDTSSAVLRRAIADQVAQSMAKKSG